MQVNRATAHPHRRLRQTPHGAGAIKKFPSYGSRRARATSRNFRNTAKHDF